MKQVLLDSIRDWVILLVVVASVLKGSGNLASTVIGAAIASFVRSALAHTYRLDERVGERCVVKVMMSCIRSREYSGRAVDTEELAAQLNTGACLLYRCKYRDEDRCSMTSRELDTILEQLVSDGVFRKRGESSYELPW